MARRCLLVVWGLAAALLVRPAAAQSGPAGNALAAAEHVDKLAKALSDPDPDKRARAEKGFLEPLGLGSRADVELARKGLSPLKDSTNKEAAAAAQRLLEHPALSLALPRVRLRLKQEELEIALFEDDAPNTVANFITLVEKKFYDGLTFHRVVTNFMAQGGCPKGDGTGNPGYKIPDEICAEALGWDKLTVKEYLQKKTPGAKVQDEVASMTLQEYYEALGIKFTPNLKTRPVRRGVVAMAHSGAPNSGGSQFFIAQGDSPDLDGRHTVFGVVVRGMSLVDGLRSGDKMEQLEVLWKRSHPYEVRKLPAK
ncbi:MAG: peptidylprolyl isomerase [Planctomycetota bacterium]|nr:peptidylprolyl isomerase [Planctomycetota bacterium]